MPARAGNRRVPGNSTHVRTGSRLRYAVALSLALHGMAVAAALAWWQSDPRPVQPAITVVLVTPQAMPPPARVSVADSLAGPARKAPAQHAPAESVAPNPDPDSAPSPAAARPLALEHVANKRDRSETDAPTAPAPISAADVSGALSMVPAEPQPAVSIELTAPAKPRAGAKPRAPAPVGTGTGPAAVTALTDKAPRFEGAGLANPLPRYPYLARRHGQEGRVVLRVLVTAAGDAKAVFIRRSSGYRLLDEAALKAVGTWRFVPARKADMPVAGAVDVPVSFRLTE